MIRLAAALCCLLMPLGVLAAEDAPSQGFASPEGLNFEVLRDGAPLGTHSITFSRHGTALHVKVEIALDVKLAFLTLFRYRHSNHEIWQDGRLVAIETVTDDDGESHWLRGEATAGGFAVESSSGSFLASKDVIPTSYWNPSILEREKLLDTQHGRMVAVAVRPKRDRESGLEAYEMVGDLNLDLWYSPEGRLAKLGFKAKGSEIDYRPLASKGPSHTLKTESQ